LAQTRCFSRLSQKAGAGLDHSFEQFSLQISNAANYENFVPLKGEQLLY
jgi:hypothetical protein